MPIGQDPTASFNVGHDVTINVMDPTTGLPISFGNITDFDSQQMTKELESAPLGGVPLFAEIPNGWSGNFTVDRANSAADDLFARLEKLYWTLGSTVAYGSISEYFYERGGTVTQFVYTNVVFKMNNSGSKKSQDKISMKINFRASTRNKVV